MIIVFGIVFLLNLVIFLALCYSSKKAEEEFKEKFLEYKTRTLSNSIAE